VWGFGVWGMAPNPQTPIPNPLMNKKYSKKKLLI